MSSVYRSPGNQTGLTTSQRVACCDRFAHPGPRGGALARAAGQLRGRPPPPLPRSKFTDEKAREDLKAKWVAMGKPNLADKCVPPSGAPRARICAAGLAAAFVCSPPAGPLPAAAPEEVADGPPPLLSSSAAVPAKSSRPLVTEAGGGSTATYGTCFEHPSAVADSRGLPALRLSLLAGATAAKPKTRRGGGPPTSRRRRASSPANSKNDDDSDSHCSRRRSSE